jgi:anti-anti-sigma factor
MGLLEITVAAGSSGPVVKLSGESDLTTAGQLRDALTAQLVTAASRLTVDARGLRFADSASIQAPLEAHRALHDAGGCLELVLRPQSVITRTLSLLGADPGNAHANSQPPPGPAGEGSGPAAQPWPYQPGHGLWLVRRAADQLTVTTGPHGSQVTVSFTLPGTP